MDTQTTDSCRIKNSTDPNTINDQQDLLSAMVKATGTALSADAATLMRYSEKTVSTGNILKPLKTRRENLLHQSLERYRTIVEDLPDLICCFQKDGTLSYVNRCCCLHFNQRAEELIGSTFFQFIPEEDREIVRNRILSLTLRNPIITHEQRTIDPDGKRSWNKWTLQARFDENGQLIEYQSIGRDITDQKESDLKTLQLNAIIDTAGRISRLIAREKNRDLLLKGVCQYLHEAFIDARAWIVLTDDAANITTGFEAGFGEDFFKMIQSQRSCRSIPCAQNALDQQGAIMAMHSDSLCSNCPLANRFSGYTGMTVRMQFDGNIYGLMTVSLTDHHPGISDQEQNLFTHIASDIALALHSIELRREHQRAETAQRRSEKEIREGGDQFQKLVENSLVGIMVIKDGKFVYKNPECIRIFMGSPASFDQLVYKSIHPDDASSFCSFYQDIASDQHHTEEIRLRLYPLKNNPLEKDVRWVLCRGSLVMYQGAQAVVLNLLDITSKKHLEQMVIINNKMSSLGRIATGISHEIRNPLSTINVCLSVLKRYCLEMNIRVDEDRPDLSDIITDMISSSNKIESVIHKVIDFAKPGIPRLIRTNINHCICNALELSAVALKKMGVHIHTELDEQLPECFLDKQSIIQILINLITNAAEAMNENLKDKIIEITTSQLHHFVIVTVSDSGPGIPPDRRNKIFDPFFTTKKNGSGIGLSICHRIVTDHRGFINISTSRWKGAKFIMGFPLEKRRQGS